METYRCVILGHTEFGVKTGERLAVGIELLRYRGQTNVEMQKFEREVVVLPELEVITDTLGLEKGTVSKAYRPLQGMCMQSAARWECTTLSCSASYTTHKEKPKPLRRDEARPSGWPRTRNKKRQEKGDGLAACRLKEPSRA